jgi:hypothetical protein
MAVEIDVMKEGKVKRTFESDKGNLAEVNLLGKKKTWRPKPRNRYLALHIIK